MMMLKVFLFVNFLRNQNRLLERLDYRTEQKGNT
jgi:hypothetical protein